MSLLAHVFEGIALGAVLLLWVLALRRERDRDAALDAQADREANRPEYLE